MSFDLSFFDAAQVEPSTGGVTLPPGRYPVVICGAEQKPTSSGDSGMLVLDFKVIQGPQTGATIKARLNLWNKSEQAAKIAASELSAIYHCIGKFRVSQPAELFNIPMQIEVAPQKSNPEYTEVVRYFDANGNPPGKAGQGAAVAQPANANANGAGNGGWGANGSAAGSSAAGNNGGGVSGVQTWGAQNATTEPAKTEPATGGWGAANNGASTPTAASGGWGAPAGGNAGGWQAPTR